MIVAFDNYRLNTDTYQLFQGDTLVAVEPQVFSVLHTLIENRHRVVSKDEMIERIWRGRIMSDAAISSRIKSARQAIGDDGTAQRLIKTVHGIGFRFVGEVNAFPSSPSIQTSGPTAEKDVYQTAGDSRPSIIVLPFQSVNEGLSIVPQGLAHDVISGLSRLRWLKVISRSSSFRVGGDKTGLEALCQLTSVRYCLSGFIEQERRQLILSVELSDILSGSVVWADRILVNAHDIHDLRSDIIKRMISVLELRISDSEAQLAQLKAPENLDAWEAYHLGIAHLYRFTEIDNRKAVALFTRAVSLEPGFARAHAGLSSAEFQNAFNLYPGVDRNDTIANATRSAEKSIELDRLDPLANFVMGRTHWLHGNTEASLPWLERALALNPNYAQGFYAHGLASLMTSNELRSYDSSEQAISLSPLDPFLYGFYGIRAFSYLADEDIDNARLWAEKAALQPESIVVMDILAASTCEMAQDPVAAAKWIDRAKARHPDIDSQYFFKALPFVAGNIRTLIQSSLTRLGL